MNCKECNKEFTPVNNRGAEQKYCSNKCRNKAGSKRYMQKVINLNNIQNEKTNIGNAENIGEVKEDNLQQGIQEIAIRGNSILPNRIHTNYDSIELLEKLYESRNETFFHKLRCEQLEKEINELKLENAHLESELDEIESNSNEGEYAGMLGGVMEQFKQDPVNTINFATELIGNLFKTKKDRKSTRPNSSHRCLSRMPSSA